MFRKLRGAAGVGLAAALLVAMTGCTPAATTGGSSGNNTDGEATTQSGPARQTTDKLTIAVNSGTLSLDPAKTGNGDPLQLFYELAYDSLFYRMPTGEIGPGLAVEWGYVDNENKVFEFKLREGVKFSDGSDLTAEGVKLHFEYYANAGGSFAGRAKNFEKIEIIDPLTVRLTLTKANPDIPDMFTERRATGAIISPLGIATPDILGTETRGAGAYMLDPAATVTGQTYVYVQNPNYWDPAKQVFNTVVIEVMTNPQAAFNAMEAGTVDYVIGTPELADAAAAAGFTVNSFPYNFAQIQFMDRAGDLVPAFGDVRVRQALNYAVDREALVEGLFGEHGTVSWQFALPGYDGYNASLDGTYAYDPEKAKALLAEAGYPNGFDFKLLAFDLQPNEVRNAQAIASFWSAIGVNAEIVVPTSAADYGPMLTGGEFAAQIFEFGGGPSYATFEQYLGMPFNVFGYQNDQINSLFTQVQGSNEQTRPALLQEIQKIMVEEAWFVPFANVNKVTFTRPGLQGGLGGPYYINPNPVFFTVED